MGVRTRLAALAALALGLAGTSASADCQFQQVAALPVTLASSRLMVPAKINGVDTKLAIDSGAFFSTISPAAVAKYRMTPRIAPYDVILSGAGGKGGFVSLAVAKDFDFIGIQFHNVDFMQNDQGFGEGVDGLIGQNFLGAFDVEYDLPDGVIRLFRATGCHDAALAYWAGSNPYSEIPLDEGEKATDLAMQTGATITVNGAPVRVILDTGAPQSTISLGAAARAGVKPGDPGVSAAGYSGGVARGSYFQIWRAPFASIKIGSEEVKNAKLLIGDMKGNGELDMLVGDDFFRSHRVLVANSQHKLYFTYSGGPVFNMKPPAASPGAAATASAVAPGGPQTLDAEGYSRRAADYVARGDYASAVADLTSAIALKPADPRFYYERGLAEMRMLGNPANPPPNPPITDFNQALTLKPDDIPALIARSNLRVLRREPALALADLNAADAAAAHDPDQRLHIGETYGRQGHGKEAIGEFDQWIAAHPGDDRMSEVLTDRCGTRALLGQDMDKAMADCNAALKLSGGSPSALAARGLVELKTGDFDRSIADLSTSLKFSPNNPLGLYARGLAKLKKGLTADGQADIKAATVLRPRIADEAARQGLTP